MALRYKYGHTDSLREVDLFTEDNKYENDLP